MKKTTLKKPTPKTTHITHRSFRRLCVLPFGQALQKFAEAHAAFTASLEMEPKNAQAKSALQMCQMQLERQHRQRAGQ